VSDEKGKMTDRHENGFLSGISIRNHYRLPDRDIPFPPSGGALFRHLMLTGPNGSGKTTVLAKLAEAVHSTLVGSPPWTDNELENKFKSSRKLLNQKTNVPPKDQIAHQRTTKLYENTLESFRVGLNWTADLMSVAESAKEGRFFAAYLPARRNREYPRPSGALPKRPSAPQTMKSAAPQWVGYLSYLHVQARLAKDDDPSAAEAIDQWLRRLETAVGELFDLPGLKFVFDRKTYDVSLAENGGPRYGFSELADGHASIFQILAEILLRNDESSVVSSIETLGNAPGIVMIDELETHLHPALQEKVFPFLVAMFPNVQFIVTTHSSAVISSIDNAVVYDLVTHEAVDSASLRGIPYGDLMKHHFGISSDIDLESTRALGRLSELYRKDHRTAAEQTELEALSNRLVSTSSPLALEVWNVLEEKRIAEATTAGGESVATESKSE
jgi:predicted ATP-binding protein involved in virulence